MGRGYRPVAPTSRGALFMWLRHSGLSDFHLLSTPCSGRGGEPPLHGRYRFDLSAGSLDSGCPRVARGGRLLGLFLY